MTSMTNEIKIYSKFRLAFTRFFFQISSFEFVEDQQQIIIHLLDISFEWLEGGGLYLSSGGYAD